jgi:hypothetical protein
MIVALLFHSDGKLGQEADIRPETIVNGRSVTIG